MNILIAFLAGCGIGWLAYRAAIKMGMRLFAADDKFLEKLLDGLGYKALTVLRSKVDDELSRRTPPKTTD